MWNDVKCIIWKEWREQFGSRGLRGMAGILLTVGVFGVVLPLQMGRSWAASPASIMVWLWVPMFMVSTVIADAFAGERERHTLETLLATRLPDRAVLFGKMAAALAYAGGVSLACLVISWITMVATGRISTSVLRMWPVLLLAVVAGLAVAVLVATIGTFISLHASTVRQATQLLTGGVVVVLLGPVVLVRSLPAPVKAYVLSDPRWLVWIPLGVPLLLVLIDAGVLLLLTRRFRRDRLLSS